MAQAFIFDLDDTLYDERSFVKGGFKAVASYMSGPLAMDKKKIYNSLLKILKDNGRGEIFDIFLKECGRHNRQTVKKMVGVYRQHEPSLVLYKDAAHTLSELKKYNLPTGLITDGDVYVQKNKVKSLGIAHFFDCLVFSDEYGLKKRKPHPLPYKKAMRSLGVKPEESVYIGDNPYKDFYTAKKLGMLTFRIMRGMYKEVMLDKEHEADYRLDRLTDMFSMGLFKAKGLVR